MLRDLQRHVRILLDEKNAHAFSMQLADDGKNFRNDEWRETYRWLVHQQQTGTRHQCARDRQHLLLTAGERTRELANSIAQLREAREHAIHIIADRGAIAATESAGHEIFLHA